MNNKKSIKLITIAGIRPQFVKVAALLYSIKKFNETSPVKVETKCINTGQHYDELLSQQLLEEFNLSFDLTITHKDKRSDVIMANSFVVLTRYLEELEQSYDGVIVFGDGNPSMVGAIVAARSNYTLIHVEAGEKRSKREHEEINRRIIDSLSDIYLCVTNKAVKNLADDGISENVYWTGDLAYEFIDEFSKRNTKTIWKDEFVLATIHRPENLEKSALRNIISALNEFKSKVFFVCHPRTRKLINQYELDRCQNIKYFEALSYAEILALIKGCSFVFSDSGGVIREAYHLRKHCVVRRNKGAWPEIIQSGINIRVDTSYEKIKKALFKISQISKKNFQFPRLLSRNDGTNYALRTLCEILSSD
jgi:UDP-N-acetylglucosamine 2-epimerase